jgi:hypothetical protein
MMNPNAFRTVLVATALLPASMLAQGNLSTQGYGYPQGQLSTRSLGTGGSIGEIDAVSPLNPAAIGLTTNRTVLFQIEPEFRTVKIGGAQERTTTDRYPVVMAAVPFGNNWVTSASSSTLLDRSWSTTTQRFESVGATDSVLTTFLESSNGAINDVRLAEAWTNRTWLSIGVGVHGITGRNVVATGRQFPDTTEFSSFAASRTLSYSGSATSIGVQMVANKFAVFGLDFRRGGKLRARTGDSTLALAHVPDHFGASAAFTGVQGSVFAVRAAHDKWSSIDPLIEFSGHAHDSWDLSGGAEISGPHISGQTLMLRTGVRTRLLPFEADSQPVRERSLSFGSGVAFAHGRMSFDVTGVRQWRTSDVPSVQERAWTLSLSLTARP